MENNILSHTSIIRPQLTDEDIKFRNKDMTKSHVKQIRKLLRILHTLELMAFNIYRFQITKNSTELNRQLIAAMANEMTHYQDFQIKLFEYGLKPNVLRWAFGFVGFAIGFSSRILGEKAMLRTNIWVESKAIQDYSKILKTVEWDAETRKVIEKNHMDENIHINRWKNLLDSQMK